MAEKLLVVGCGLRPKAGAVNLDCVALPGVDVVFDLDTLGQPQTYWYASRQEEMFVDGTALTWDTGALHGIGKLPFHDGRFDRIEAEDVLEHVADPVAVIQELGRVLRPGGVLWVRGPDCRYPEIVWADLTHRRAFALRTFDGFCPDTYDGQHYGYYHGPIKFKMMKIEERNKGLEFTMERLP